MRIDELKVENFRGIRELHLKDLQSTVVIAGANGSGKSCVFDAIRLLKSAYGGYQQNEWHHWMAEFQINFTNNAEAFQSFFQDRSRELSIECHFRLHPKEREYLEKHGEDLVRHSVWRLIAPEMYGWSSYRAAPMAAQYRDREQEVAEKTKEQIESMLKELSQDKIIGRLWANSGSQIQFSPSKALEIIFSSFIPGEIGLVDYHGAQRMYTREQVSNVNLDINSQGQQNKDSALYNYNTKYSNVKTEMAGSYVKELLSKEAGVPIRDQNRISSTLKELFLTFFPDKEFLGLKPTIEGGLEFPVRTKSGAIHDLNELSAGEKEVLFGYLRIRNSAPCYSIILIDEPELHLNPRLVRGLPQFYHQHLGIALDNQIWLVTHSDTLLREVVGRPEYSVYHMVGATLDLNMPQVVPITMGEEAERAIISLVGDIAAYQPGKKIIIFEGGGDSEFDVQMTTRLFPEILTSSNVISGGNKLRVRELHDILDEAEKKGVVPFKVYSITDKDMDKSTKVNPPRFRWEVYHIENYLLEPSYIRRTLIDLGDLKEERSEEWVYDRLRKAAAECLKDLVGHEMTKFVNDTIVSSLDFKFDPKRQDVAVALSEAAARSQSRIDQLFGKKLDASALDAMEQKLRSELTENLATDAWRRTFRGRDVLNRFVRDNSKSPYEVLRNLIIARMGDDGFKPKGMAKIVSKILEQ